jgi:iron complex outermembrane receptor protein
VYFANGANTRTRGFDIVGDYSLSLGNSRLALDAAFNYNHTKVTSIAAPPAVLGNLGANPSGSLIFLPRTTIGDLTVNLPKSKLVLGAHWSLGRVTVNLNETRYGSYDWVRSEIAAQDTHYGAKWLTDADVTVRLWKGLKISAGAANLFGVRPDKNGPGDPATGSAQFRYGPAPFSPMGGFYYGKLAIDL